MVHVDMRTILSPSQRNAPTQTPGQGASLVSQLAAVTPGLLTVLLAEGHIRKNRIDLRLQAKALAERLDLEPEAIDPLALTIEAPFDLRRRGVEGKIVVGDRAPQPDRTLLRALSQAHAWVADLRGGKPLGEIAAATRHWSRLSSWCNFPDGLRCDQAASVVRLR
ncbi:MAG: hypothetical protein ACE368_13430, partial [Paracoccaceae bacterium]